MFVQAYKKALQQYFISIIIGLVLAAVTFVFWIGVPLYLWGHLLDVENFPQQFRSWIIFLSISFLLMLYFAPFHWQVAKNMPHVKRSFLTIQLIMTVISTVVIYGIYTWNEFRNQPDFTTEVYEFPADFQGCAIIFYDVEAAPPLEITDGKLTKSFLQNGEVLLTSSPQQFGWANDDHSGWHQVEIYVGEELLPGDAFHMSNGSFEGDSLQFDFSLIIAAETASCYEDFEYPEQLYKQFVWGSISNKNRFYTKIST